MSVVALSLGVLLLLASPNRAKFLPGPHGVSGAPMQQAAPQPWPLDRIEPHQACKRSNMCSHGKVQPFLGDVNPSSGLHAALAARSHNKEVIFIPMHRSMSTFLIVCIQLYLNLEFLGFSHVMMLANDQMACEVVATTIPNIGCVWDSSPFRHNAMDPTWLFRVKMQARVPRLGYNTLMMDADSIMFQDPYLPLYATPLTNITFLCMPEGQGGCYCNGGYARVQNARPDGAVTWVMKEFVERAYRAMDDGYHIQVANGMQSDVYALNFDQDALDDALKSAMARQQVHPILLERSNVTERDSYRKHAHELFDCWDHRLELSEGEMMPAELHSTLGAQSVQHRTWRLHVPDSFHKRDTGALGPWLVPNVPNGNYSSHFLKQLKEDCLDCPWWPDVAGNRSAQHDASHELFAIAPDWLVSSTVRRGVQGYWAAPQGHYAPQVTGHIHYSASDLFTDQSALSKRTIQSHFGYAPQPFDWQMMQKLSAMLAHLNHMEKKEAWEAWNLTGYSAIHVRERLIIVNPDMDTSAIRTIADYQALAKGLIQLAHLSERSFIWPPLPCTSPVFPVCHSQWKDYAPPTFNSSDYPCEAFPFFSALTQRLACQPIPTVCAGCMMPVQRQLKPGRNHLSAILTNEVPHWLQSHGMSAGSLGAESEKVAWVRHKGGSGQGTLRMSEAEAASLMEKHAHVPVVVLDAVVEIGASSQAPAQQKDGVPRPVGLNEFASQYSKLYAFSPNWVRPG